MNCLDLSSRRRMLGLPELTIATCAAALLLGGCHAAPRPAADALAQEEEAATLLTGSNAPMSADEPAPAPEDVLQTATTTLRVGPGQYAAAFETMRDELRNYGFILERVDAQLGVITTRQKGTAGVATPWDREQGSVGQEFEDLIQRQKRIVRVECLPSGTTVPTLRDLRREPGPIDLRVSVAIVRWQQPGWRINTQAILYSTYATDPQLAERGMSLYGVAIKQDQEFAQRLVERVQNRLSAAGSTAASQAATDASEAMVEPGSSTP